VAILGELVGVNSAGKPTQLRIIADLDEPDCGAIIICLRCAATPLR
jgi:ABC-type Na+ transport system ATPase subunit NatA